MHTNLIELYADRFHVFDNDLCGSGVQSDLEVPSVTERPKKGGGGALSDAVLAHRLSDREAGELIAVKVLRDWVAFLRSRREDVAGDVGPPRESLDGQQPVGRVIFAPDAIDLRVVLRAGEVRQNLHNRGAKSSVSC